jgi:hypothetical protein
MTGFMPSGVVSWSTQPAQVTRATCEIRVISRFAGRQLDT